MFLNLLKIIIISIFIIIISHIFYYYIYNKLIEPPISPDIEHIRQQYEKLVANLSTITPISPPEYSTLNHMNNNNLIIARQIKNQQITQCSKASQQEPDIMEYSSMFNQHRQCCQN